jgi:pimeloyl-ACP methyl ester carboxylesterase
VTMRPPTDPDGEYAGDVHVVVEGERTSPAVAMIHGVPGSVRDFRYLGPAVAARGLCAVRIDMPGFGKTPASAFAGTRGPDRAAFVRGVMRALGHRRFAVCGHSFGGGTALLAAALFPDDVTAVACVNSIGPRRHRGGVPTSLAFAAGEALALPVVGAPLHEALAAGYGARGLKSDVGLDVDVVRHHARVVAGLEYADLRAACAGVRCPALVASSADDPLVETASSFALARALVQAPLSSHLHTKTGGHFLQKLEAESIAAWLRRAVTR